MICRLYSGRLYFSGLNMKEGLRRGCAAIAFVVASVGAFAQFQMDGVRLLANVKLSSFSGSPSSGSAIHGYTSPTGREYAVIGLRNGKHVVDITQPQSPVEIGFVSGPNSTWHEQTVLGDFAYGVTEAGGGMTIIDLRQADMGVVTSPGAYQGNGLNSVHTIEANPVSKTLYLNGSNLAGGGLLALDVSNPVAPVEVGRWNVKYVHDSLVKTYTSGQYAGKEIVFACCGDAGLRIIDATNKASMTQIGALQYVFNGYSHSASISPDAKFLFVNDEFDELNGVTNTTTTYVIDIQDLSNPKLIRTFTNGVGAIDHNSNYRDGYLFLAAYTSGMRVYAASEINNIRETGFFDSYPSGDVIDFAGNWGVFAQFPSGNVIISDMQRGLFVLDPSEAIGQGAVPVDLNFERGKLVSGTLKDIRLLDQAYMDTQSGPAPSSSEPNNVRFIMGFQTTRKVKNAMNIHFDGRIVSAPSGTLNILVKNWQTGQFDQVGQYFLLPADRSFTVPNLGAGPYIDPNGRIEVKIFALANAQSLKPLFELLINRVQVVIV